MNFYVFLLSQSNFCEGYPAERGARFAQPGESHQRGRRQQEEKGRQHETSQHQGQHRQLSFNLGHDAPADLVVRE